MAVLLTGAAGFIGSHLAERLLADKSLAETSEPLLLLDNLNDSYDPRQKVENLAGLPSSARVTTIVGDFCDAEFVDRLLSEHAVRQIIHLAAYPGVPESLTHPRRYIDTNVGGTLTLLDAVRRHPVERFLFASSSTVYGRGAAVPFVEDAPLGIPLSPYGASKRAAEILGQTYHLLYGIPFVSLRFFNVYGPRLRPELALAVFTRAILNEQPLPLYGDGAVLRDFTHVSDICTGILAALHAPNLAGECLNLGHDEPIEIRRLIELIEQAAGKRALIERRPSRVGDMPLTHADLTKSRRLLNYHPRVSIEVGVREYVEWFKTTGER